MHNMQNIQNMHNMISMYYMQNMQYMQTWTPVAFVLLQHRNKGTHVLVHPGIGLGFNCEQQKQFAGPDLINSGLKSAFGESRRADEHPVLSDGLSGLLQFLWCHQPTRNAHLTRMFYIPNQEGCIQANVPPRGVHCTNSFNKNWDHCTNLESLHQFLHYFKTHGLDLMNENIYNPLHLFMCGGFMHRRAAAAPCTLSHAVAKKKRRAERARGAGSGGQGPPPPRLSGLEAHT
jgi:hypothetical protein